MFKLRPRKEYSIYIIFFGSYLLALLASVGPFRPGFFVNSKPKNKTIL